MSVNQDLGNLGSVAVEGRDIQGTTAKDPWYAVQVRPRTEKLIAQVLEHKGFENYLPLYRVRRRWSDRFKEVELPLFPGYVFCRLDFSRRILPLLTTPGVVRILGVGRAPCPVPEHEIEAIDLVIRSGYPVFPWNAPRIGQPVCLEYGPLAGVAGILIGFKKRSRLVVSVSILKRSVAVEIESDWARPIDTPAPTATPTRGTTAVAPVLLASPGSRGD